MTERTRTVSRLVVVYLAVGAGLVMASCLLGYIAITREDQPFAIDTWWNTLMADWANPFLLWFAHVLDFVGGGWMSVFVIPIAGAIALVILRRPWSAVYFLAAEAASALGVQVLKHTFGRVRPDDIIVVSDYGSYPSGHVANAATIAVAALIIFPTLWVAIAGAAWVLLMAFSRTYLHAHWLSDTLGGAMIGAGAALLVAAAFAVLMARERVDAPAESRSLG